MDLFLELQKGLGILFNTLQLLVVLTFVYLYFSFRNRAKKSGYKIYKHLSLGFFFTFISILIPMVSITFGTSVLGDVSHDHFYLYNDLPYFLATFASLGCFILAAKAKLEPDA